MELHEVQRPGRVIDRTVRPESVHAALVALRDRPNARLIAGGTDLLLDLQRGGAGDPVDLVDLSAISDSRFTEIEEHADVLVLGGGVTHNMVVDLPAAVTHALPLAQACVEVGSPQLRNRATVAGNVATASPANDTISALMALGATVELASLTSTASSSRWGDHVAVRHVPIADFFSGFRSTVMRDDEVITAITVPKLLTGHRGLWVKLGLRRAQAISVIHAGIVVDLDGDRVVQSARLALGSMAATVVVVDAFAEALVGHQLDHSRVSAAARATAAAVEPISDVRATAEYRSDTVVTVIERSLNALVENRQSEMWLDQPPTLSEGSRRNGSRFVVQAESDSLLLLDALRADGLTGVKEGCAEGECGACTVRIDGTAVMSCLVTAAQADGADVITAQHLAGVDALDAVQQAFVDEFAAQCGFCIPGFVVAVSALLDEVPDPSDEQIAMALSGNLCRCTGYYPIIEAVKSAARVRSNASTPRV